MLELMDDGPGAAEIAAANAWLKDHSIPETFSMEGAGLRMCDPPDEEGKGAVS